MHHLVEREYSFSQAIRDYCAAHNGRRGDRAREGQEWVRIRPPSPDEALEFRTPAGNSFRFVRVGTIVTVTEVQDSFFTLRCGSVSIIWAKAEFFRTFVRCIPEKESDMDSRASG